MHATAQILLGDCVSYKSDGLSTRSFRHTELWGGAIKGRERLTQSTVRLE